MSFNLLPRSAVKWVSAFYDSVITFVLSWLTDKLGFKAAFSISRVMDMFGTPFVLILPKHT
ncbi:MAG: hypothetical protein JRJ23_10125 [Deltaproteobacteria bacterium]|nr:hypothetical protein [Deltaproteobacteria bacterium]MBW1914645.1 hypothetical protein [Deltaproteobacteria bacterium]